MIITKSVDLSYSMAEAAASIATVTVSQRSGHWVESDLRRATDFYIGNLAPFEYLLKYQYYVPFIYTECT